MPKRIDLTGQVFGKLTVVEYSHNTYWICKCECGEVRTIQAGSLKTGNTASCGCYRREVAKSKATTHGMYGSSEYISWGSMIKRCTNPKTRQYSDYGGRGIIVCPEWRSFENFYKDMGPRPSSDHSLDRKDNDGPYCKENCRWATRKEQNNNQRSNKLLTHNGETRSISQWAEETGIPYATLRNRIAQGWSVEKALTTSVRTKNSKGGV